MGDTGAVFKRIISGKHASWKNGEFFLWNIPSFLIPVHTYIDMISSFESAHENTRKILYAVGEKQAILATDFLKKRFGVQKEVDLIRSVLEEGQFMGFGEFKLTRFDEKTGSAIFKNDNNPYAKHFKQMKGLAKEPIDAYFAGTKVGIVEAVTGKKLICVETKCIAAGDPYCLFEVRPTDTFSEKELAQTLSPLLSPDEIRATTQKEMGIIKSSPRK